MAKSTIVPDLVKQYVLPMQLFTSPVDYAIDTIFSKYGIVNTLKSKLSVKHYKDRLARIVEGYLKEHLLKRYKPASKHDEYLLRYQLLRLLQENGIDINAKIYEEGIALELINILYDDILTRLSNEVIEDKEIYLITSNPFMEWDIKYTNDTLILIELGDYRIRRYYELIKDGVINE